MDMTRKALLAAAMLGTLGAAACTASRPDSPPGAPPNPYLGDPGGATLAPASRSERNPNNDRPSPSSTNGNQPDRAAAGGGAR